MRDVRSNCALIVGVCLAWTAGTAVAQNPPVNASLVGSWNGYAGEYGDVWGDGDHAYVGSFTLIDGLPGRVHIVDISDPTTPTLANTYFLPSPNEFRSPQDVKVANGLLFIGLESGGTDVVLIVDVRNPASPALLTKIQLPGFFSCHNTFYDNGFLYVVDSANPQVAVVDLRTYNPDFAPATITSALWTVTNVGTVFVHDITVRNGRLYAAGWDSGLFVYDVSDVANTAPALIGTTGGNNTHAMWPTDDGNFVVVGEERGGGGIKVYRITDNAGSLSFTQTDSLVLSDDAFSVHNQLMIGNRLYVSWYQAGLQVFDVNSLTGALEFFASYDTSTFANTGGFAGCWGAYPMFGDDRVLLSDLEEGLVIVSLQGPLLTISYPDGLVDMADPAGGTQLRVAIDAGNETPDPNSALLFTAIDGGPFSSSPMIFDVDAFVGTLPAAPCGSTIDYYVSVDTMGGTTVTEPADAPTGFYSALAALALTPAITINFENTIGWAVSGNATDGQWEAGVPAGDGTRGDPLSDFDGSGQCYLTDNVIGNSDVDGGSTVLTSPTFNLSGLTDPFVSYARWYSNSGGASPQQDIFVVEISADGAVWVELETVGPSGPEVAGEWFVKTFKVSDFIVPSSTVQLRFTASDLDPGSVVEAAVDALEFSALECETVVVTPIPTVSQWGLAVMALLTMAAGTLVFRATSTHTRA